LGELFAPNLKGMLLTINNSRNCIVNPMCAIVLFQLRCWLWQKHQKDHLPYINTSKRFVISV